MRILDQEPLGYAHVLAFVLTLCGTMAVTRPTFLFGGTQDIVSVDGEGHEGPHGGGTTLGMCAMLGALLHV